MNDKTGEIRNLTNEQVQELNSLKGQGKWHDVSLMTPVEMLNVQNMSRRERRIFLRKQTKEKQI